MKTYSKIFLRAMVCVMAAMVVAMPQALAQSTQKISVPTDVEKWISSTFARD